MNAPRIRKPNRRPNAALRQAMAGERCDRTGKVRLVDERSARMVADELARKGDPEPEQLRIFRCRTCGDWHVGHAA